MIVEDANGNHYDLTDIDDDREPVPADEPHDVAPVDLDEVEQRAERLRFLYPPGLVVKDITLTSEQDLAALRQLIGHDVPGLIADLREARTELKRLRANPGAQYAITDGAEPETAAIPATFEQLNEALARPDLDKAFWVRDVYAQPWTRLSTEPPF